MVDQAELQSDRPKRGRGRPRIHPAADPSLPRRGRGRPRKDLVRQEPGHVQVVAPSQLSEQKQSPLSTIDPSTIAISSFLEAVEPEVMSWPEAPITVEQFTAPTASRESKFPAPKWPAIARQIRKTYRRQSKQILAGVVVVLVALLSIVGSRLVHHSTVANDAKTALSREGLVARVGRLTELPAGEQPMVYTVTDQARLSQPFLKNAKTGDQVLIYQQAGRAIVYRTSTDKVVAIGPLTGAQSITQSTDVSAQPSIALYNGSQTAGVTSNFEQKLTSLGPLQVVMREKAARSDYARSQVIDVGGTKSDMAKKIAVLIDADVVALPASETAPQADILIIIGNSQK